MKLEIELWQVVTVLIAVTGGFWGMAKLLLSQSQKHIDEQFKAIAATLRGQSEDSRRLERELLDLKAELPREYVRRGDHDRVIGSVMLSIENLRLTIERALTQRPGP